MKKDDSKTREQIVMEECVSYILNENCASCPDFPEENFNDGDDMIEIADNLDKYGVEHPLLLCNRDMCPHREILMSLLETADIGYERLFVMHPELAEE